MLSIITLINNKEIYEVNLHATLNCQEGIDYEIITLYNIKNSAFSSLASAYNYAINKVKGEWLLFIHPDIQFLSKNSLYQIVEMAEKIRKENINAHIFGLAGVEKGKNDGVITSMVHGSDKAIAGRRILDKGAYKKVQTIDACFMLVDRYAINKICFWERLSNYHWCIEEYCLNAERNHIDVFVIASDVWHISNGKSMNYIYYREAIKVAWRYRGIDYINTSTYSSKYKLLTIPKLFFYMCRNYFHHKWMG